MLLLFCYILSLMLYCLICVYLFFTFQMSKSYQAVIFSLVVLCIFLLYSSPLCVQQNLNRDNIKTKPHHPVTKFKVSHSADDLELYVYSAILDDRLVNLNRLSFLRVHFHLALISRLFSEIVSLYIDDDFKYSRIDSFKA